jgi:hypothetical protein
MNNAYTCVEELLSDESFLLYCDHTNAEIANIAMVNAGTSDAETTEESTNGRGSTNGREIETWRDWINSDPSRKALAEQALELLNAIREAEKQITEREEKQWRDEQVPSALRALMRSIEEIEQKNVE